MIEAIDELKIRAQLLHKGCREQDVGALRRIAALPGGAPAELQRKHCLRAVARELGFRDYPHAAAVLGGDDHEDYGKLLWPGRCSGFMSNWFTDHREASEARALRGGYLLPYMRQFFIVTREFIEVLGLDPDDVDWERMAWDWARPRDPAARLRLLARLLAFEPRETSRRVR